MRRFLPVSVACQISRSETDGLPVTVRLSGWPSSATLASPSSSEVIIPDSMSESRSLSPLISFPPKTPHSFLCVYFFIPKKIKHDEQPYDEGREGPRFVLSIEQPNADPFGSDPR
jgi:hypothetical protein